MFKCLLYLNYNYNEDTNNSNEKDISGRVYYISGCRDSQVSMEYFINNKSQGALTSSFINTLQHSMTWSELIQSLQAKLQDQTPQLSTSKMVNINTEKCFF